MKNLRSLRLPTLLMTAALMAGCSSDKFSAPSGSDVSAPLSNGYVSKLIGPSGGTLSVTGVEVQVPAGALSGTVLMTMTKLDNVTVELGPHGLQFNSPVSLNFTLPSGADAAAATVRWFDPSAQVWTVIPSMVSSGNRIAPLQHFSKYRIEAPTEAN